MKISEMVEILRIHRDSTANCALNIIEATRDCTEGEIRDAFAVVLGIGYMNEMYAARLFASFERLADLDEIESLSLRLDPSLAALRYEVEQLRSRLQELRSKEIYVANLKERIAKLEVEWTTSKSRAESLRQEIENLQTQLCRMDAIESEVANDDR
jgi:predicted nuclease with TOPRIM domain